MRSESVPRSLGRSLAPAPIGGYRPSGRPCASAAPPDRIPLSPLLWNWLPPQAWPLRPRARRRAHRPPVSHRQPRRPSTSGRPSRPGRRSSCSSCQPRPLSRFTQRRALLRLEMWATPLFAVQNELW